jgi:CBS domain-containing protein
MSLDRFRRTVQLAAEEDLIPDVARKMRDARVGCVVVARAGRPIGILTDRDIALRVVAEGRDPTITRVSEVVTYDPIVLVVDADIGAATALVRSHGIRRIPIVDASGQVVGIVTSDELLVLVGKELSDLCAGIEEGADTTESR